MRKLKRFRTFAGFTQKELAKIGGVAPSTYNGYESGGSQPPNVEVALAFVEAINRNLPEGYSTTVEEIFSEDDDNEGATNDTNNEQDTDQ